MAQQLKLGRKTNLRKYLYIFNKKSLIKGLFFQVCEYMPQLRYNNSNYFILERGIKHE